MARDLVELKKAVKAANDIVDVIAGYIAVTPAGKVFKSLCPFHNDSRPSMQVDRHYQNFHCWSCGARGDVFDFVEKIEKVGFKDALTLLARRANIALEADTPADSHKSLLFEVMRWAQHQYATHLMDGEGADAARKYVGERHLSGATVRQFGLGFAPIDGEWLVGLAERDRVPFEQLVEVGLLGVRDQDRGHYHRFRDRVMFPIRDVQGRTVGFGGRILPDSPFAARGPKYYNSAETPLFRKSECLYGLDLARHAGSQAGYLAVVEGYTDVMMAHQAGIANVVATMGTALNGTHVAQLRRYAPRVVLLFDADDGGQTGVDRALDTFVSQDVELAVAQLPDGLDPADLLARPGGADTFRETLRTASDALEFKLDQLLRKDPRGGIDAARRMVDAVLGIIALAPAVPSQAAAVKQELILTRLAQRLGVRLDVVRKRLGELQLDQRRQAVRDAERAKPMPMAGAARVTAAPRAMSERTALEKQLLQLLLADPALVLETMPLVAAESVEHTGIRRIVTELYNLARSGEPPDMDALRVRLLDRPDLATAALDSQQIGRSIPDRAVYHRKIVAGFARLDEEATRRRLKDELSAMAPDDPERAAKLREYQARSRPRPGAA